MDTNIVKNVKMNIVNSKINKIQNYIVLDKNKQIYYKGDIRKCLTFVFDKAYYDNIKELFLKKDKKL